MRPFFLTIFSVATCALLAGCAAGLRAESMIPPMNLSSSPDAVRVRILYTRSPARLEATGPFLYQSKKGGKIYSGQKALRVRAMRSQMVLGHQSFKGDVAVIPVNSTDTLRLNGRRYRGALVFHPIGSGRYDVVEMLGLEEYLYGVLPREVGSDWPLESLKAQAVVSRTYVIGQPRDGPRAALRRLQRCEASGLRRAGR